MWRILWLFVGTALVLAGQSGDRITVPFSNPGQPGTVRVNVMRGAITVRAHAGREVIVEGKGIEQMNQRAPVEMDGLKRIDIGRRGFDLDERDNVVSISVGPHSATDLSILVPASTSLKLKSMQGRIDVENVTGEIEAGGVNGPVNIAGAAGPVVANAVHGDVVVSFNQVPQKPMSFSTVKGNVDVSMPPSTRARLKIRTEMGEVYSDFEIKPAGDAAADKYGPRARYADLNGGGPEISLRVVHGDIRIRQKK